MDRKKERMSESGRDKGQRQTGNERKESERKKIKNKIKFNVEIFEIVSC